MTGADGDQSPLLVEPSGAVAAQRWRLDPRSFLYVVGVMLIALAIIAITRNSAGMLTRIAIGVFIALALDPVVGAIQRRLGMRRGLAVGAVAVLIVGFAALVVGVLGPRAVTEVEGFSRQFPETVGELERLPIAGGWIADQDLESKARDWVGDLPDQFTDQRLGETARHLVTGVMSVAIVAVVAVAVLKDGPHLVSRFRRILHDDHRRAQADQVGRVVYRTLGRYFGGSLTVALMMGLFVLAVGILLGIPLAPLAALWAMLTNLIPQIGGALGGGFFVLLAVTEGVPTAIAAGVLFGTYMTLENHVIQPVIIGKSVDLSPPTTMVAVLVGAAVAGVPGALVATPVVGAAKQLLLEASGRRPSVAESDDQSRFPVIGAIRDRLRRIVTRHGG